MSNEWDLLCRTCDVKCQLDWNHGSERIVELIPLLPLIAQMRPVENILCGWFVEFGFPRDLLAFSERHHGHDLIPVDEYGDLYGACGLGYRCGCCKTWLHCKLLAEHDGDHGQEVQS